MVCGIIKLIHDFILIECCSLSLVWIFVEYNQIKSSRRTSKLIFWSKWRCIENQDVCYTNLDLLADVVIMFGYV